MLADGASTILEDAELRNAERQAAEGNSWPGGRQGPVSQGGPYGMTLQGSAVRLPTQSNAQFTWRGIAEAPAHAGQFNGMGRLPPAMGGVSGGGQARCDGGLMEYAGGGGEQAPSSRSSGTPGSHVFATPSWHSMVPDASALARGILRGGEVRPGLGQIGGGSGSGTSWAGTASAHWWAAGVSASPQSRGVVTSAPSGAMFQSAAGMQGYSAVGDAGRYTAGSNGPVSVESCGNVATSMSSGDGWGSCGPDSKGGVSGRNKRKRPPSLSCIEAAAVATAAAAACRAGGEESLYFGNTTARRRVDQGEEVDGGGGSNGGGGGCGGGSNCRGVVNSLNKGGGGGGGGGGGVNNVGTCGGNGGNSNGNGSASSGGNGGNNGTMLLPPLPTGGGLKWGAGAGGNVVLAPLTPMTPFASGDGWTLPMTPQRTAEAWTPTAAGSETLGRGDSWTFSITPRTPRDLTLQVM
jgi:hypothetical protein